VASGDWISLIHAYLAAWYPGQEGGTALAEILFGLTNPSGKLPVSFEKRWEDNATFTSYYDADRDNHVKYTEGIFVGYRHFDKNNIEPLFPFGYGLSYTGFAFNNMVVKKVVNGPGLPIKVEVTFNVTNTGKKEGAEVAQVYIHKIKSGVIRPVKELKGFSKVFLKAGETKRVNIILNHDAFEYYDVEKKSWVVEPGDFEFLVGSSSRDIRLKKTFGVE